MISIHVSITIYVDEITRSKLCTGKLKLKNFHLRENRIINEDGQTKTTPYLIEFQNKQCVPQT